MKLFKQKIKSIIFDFDGTIADSSNIHEQAFKEALISFKVNFDYKDYAGKTSSLAISEILENNKVVFSQAEIDAAVKEKRFLAYKYIKERLSFVNGAEAFLNLVMEKKIPSFLASSGSRKNVHSGLKKLKIFDFFTDILTADDVLNGKPDPEIFNKIIERNNLEKANTLIVEDAMSGIVAALNADIQVVCIDENTTFKNLEVKSKFYISYENLQKEIEALYE